MVVRWRQSERDRQTETDSPPGAAQNVVEVLTGFVISAHAGNVKVQLPVPRAEPGLAEQVAEATASARL